MDVCTIVARNYLAPARVLTASFHAQHPDGRCWVLVIDDPRGEIDGEGEPFELLRPEQLGIEPWEQMAAAYGPLELSTAVKPWLVRHLLAGRGLSRVTYLDPDIQVLGSLEEIDRLLAGHALVVNPHITAPIPRDGRRPGELEILQSGSFNLGLAGFSAHEELWRLLDWWSERLQTQCLVALEQGLFVDQRWMDLAPGLVSSIFVLRDPGYNVAYWNLAGRKLEAAGGRYTIDGHPLRCFHFSGYDPAAPQRLSRHQNRIEVAADPVLSRLCNGYARALAQAGHGEWRLRPYAFGCLPDGTPLDPPARAVYRQAIRDRALRASSVFTPEGASELLAHLRGPVAGGGPRGVSRYLAAVRDSREDLRAAFAGLEGPDGERLVAWAQLADEVPATLRPGAGSTDRGARAPMVNAAGYFRGVMGTGEHGRQLVSALRGQGIEVALHTLHPEASPEDHRLAPAGGGSAGRAGGQGRDDADSGSPDSPRGFATGAARSEAIFNLVCVNAESLPGVARQLGAEFFGERYTIGFWAWEVSAFPERYAPAFAYLDEVWVGSRHVAEAIAPLAPVPVIAIPQPVSVADESPSAPPPELPEGFRFMFAFDYLSVFERKNPLAVISAFAQAFEPGSGASLIVKALNPERDPDAHARLKAAAAAHPDVHLLTRRLTAAEQAGLMGTIDCYVSLHRAEGFGYTMAEAMWKAKPVIATAYSGNLDFMSPEISYLVDHRLVAIGPGNDPYPAGGVWAEPDIQHAAALMREVFADPQEARRRGELAAAAIRQSHGPQAAGRFMARRLERILASASPVHSRAWTTLDTAWLSELIRSGPVPPGTTPRFGGAQRRARRALLRALAPITVHERLVAGELLAAIERLDARLSSLQRAHTAALRRIAELERAAQDGSVAGEPRARAAGGAQGDRNAQAGEQRSGRS